MVSLLSTRAAISLPKLGFRGGLAPVRWLCSSLVEAPLLPTCWGFYSSVVPKPVHPYLPCSPTTTLPYHHTKPHRISLSVPSSPTLSYLSPLARLASRHRQNPKPLFQIYNATVGASVCTRPNDFVMPSCRAQAKSAGRRSYLLRPAVTAVNAPQGTCSLAFPMALLPFAALRIRPPPEPPPCSETKLVRKLAFLNLIISNRTSKPSHGRFETPASASAPRRPPPKPTWIDSSLCVIVYAPDGIGWLFLWGYVSIKLSIWSPLSGFHFGFVEVIDLNILLVISFSKSYTGTMVVISTFNFPSYRQAAFVRVVCLDHRETTHSRTVHILDKEMIRNWIDSKTVASPSIMAIYHGWKLFDWLIGLVSWFDVEPLWFVVGLCIDSNVVYVLTIRRNSCLGYAPTLSVHPECTVFSQLIK